MNENIALLYQVVMWGLGIQTTLILGALGFMWNHFNKKFDEIEKRFDRIDQRFEKLENRMIKQEFDMIEVKTILRMKECCMIQDERHMKKAE